MELENRVETPTEKKPETKTNGQSSKMEMLKKRMGSKRVKQGYEQEEEEKKEDLE